MAEENELFTIEDGVLTECQKDAVDVEIPEGVTEIGDFAFCNCHSLETLYLPSTLEKIGYRAILLKEGCA